MLGFLFSPKKKVIKQTTFIYCNKCNNEICSDGSFVSDTQDENNDNHVKYKCKECGKKHDFNFDIAPVPVNWNKLKPNGS